ncbi:MAG TPA: MBL fold metallo-hydrolase [Acholeplasma sp.]|jgi:L-ascorbate metabolism protein UlaG (beta-lactamase superfamily)
MPKLLYQGHASFRITTDEGLVIYIDPFAGKGYDKKADLVLITHHHQDHTKTDLITLKDDGKIIYGKELHPSIDDYQETTFKGIRIKAVPAYNQNHPKELCVGFLVWINDILIYHSGDTSKIEEMAQLNDLSIDYALLCGDGKYNMGLKEAGEVAELIGAKKNIPMHLAPGELFDAYLASQWKVKNKLVMEPGDEIKLTKKV